MNPTTDVAAATFATHVAMLGWFPLCLALFGVFKPAKAAAIGLVAGFLLLPNVSYDVLGLPAYDKTMAVSASVFVAALVFDSKRMLAFRPGWVDVPIALLLVTPFVSGVHNDLGVWRGLSDSFDFTIRWGLPWLLGRAYVGDPIGQRLFADAIVGGALLYVPLCAWEIRMSPQLHRIVYGIPLKAFKHAQRGSLWKPNVFTNHGLMLALFMACAAVLAYWIWTTKTKRTLFGIPMGAVTTCLVVTTIACSSMNAILMMFTGIACLFCSRRFGWRFPVLLLVLVPVAYLGVRQGLRWEGRELVSWSRQVFGPGRASSLRVRLLNEALLADRIDQEIWLGYGDFREFTGNTDEQNVATVDSMWLLYWGVFGLASLIGLFGLLLLPILLLWRTVPPAFWSHPTMSVAAALAVIALLMALDFLLNAHENPLLTAAAGGVACLLGTPKGRATWLAR